MRFILIAALLVTPLAANSALIDNGDYTTDTVSGRDWLDLTETTGIAFETVLAELGTGGLYEGWSIASLTDVTTLFTNAGGDGVYFDALGEMALALNLLPLWGITDPYIIGPYNRSYFNIEDFTAGTPTSGIVLHGVDGIGYEGRQTLYADNFAHYTPGHSVIGTALYRTSIVPVPAAVWLFGSALAGLGWMRRKQTV
jgi:hypothetical protein